MCNTVEVAKCKRAEKGGSEIVGDCCIIIIIYYLVLAFDPLLAIMLGHDIVRKLHDRNPIKAGTTE
jgi:hypothetical protein